MRPEDDAQPAALRDLLPPMLMDLVAAIGVGVSGSMVITLLPVIGRRDGLEPIGLAAVASAPFVGNVVGLLAGRVGPSSTRQFAALRFLSAISLVGVPFLPMPGSVVLVAMLFWLALSLSAPFQFRFWGLTYPATVLARVIGVLGTGRAAAAAVAAVAGGVIADRLGGSVAVAIGGAVGAACALSYAWLRDSRVPAARYRARDSMRAVRSNAAVARLAVAQAIYGGGFISATPLFALVYVDRLDLSLAEVGAIGVLGSVSTSLSSVGWGAVADRFGASAPTRFGSVIGAVGLLAYALAPDILFVCLAAVAVGLTLPAIEVGILATIARDTAVEERAVTIGGWHALMGARGMVAPFIVTSAIQAQLIDLTTGLLACALACAVGVRAYWMASLNPRPRV